MDREDLIDAICSYYMYIVSLVRTMGADESDVEDIAEEALLAAVKAADQLRDPDKMKAWLKTITANIAKKYFRKKYRRREISNFIIMETGEEIDIYDFVADELTVEHIFQQEEDVRIVKRAVGSLTGLNKVVVNMRFFGEYKFSEIAEALALNENTVKSIYRRSLKKLRKSYYELSGKEYGCE